MLIDRRFVSQHQFLLRAVRDAHHIHIAKLRPAFAPVSVGHDVKSPDLSARFNLSPFGHCPMKQGVESRDALAAAERFNVFQES